MDCKYSKSMTKSPLRYPGGKGSFYSYFSELMIQNGLNGGKYFEPYAGGSGVALGLLASNVVSEVILNDIDYHIYCFWNAVLNENEHFIAKIQNVELSIKEWHIQKEIYIEAKKYSIFEVGFSTFFLNRCNRSGILLGAGPIGGYEQKGYWQLDARFNKEDLITRISAIASLKSRICIENTDAIIFLKKYLPRGQKRKDVFVYLDPPYVSAGNRLYLNPYSDRDHKILANYLLGQNNLKWVVTYDDNILIRNLYSSCQKWLFYLGYSLQSKQKGKELLIAPELVELPNKNKITSNRWRFFKKIKEN